MGMPAIAERGEPEPPQDDLAIAQARVDALEVKLKAAWQAHYAAFPGGRCGPEQRTSLQGVQNIESELGWAKKQLDLRQKYADAKRADATHTASADLPKNRIFEVLGPDGRVLRHRAHSVDQLRAELKPGFVPITEVFGFKSDGTGGIAAALDTSVPSITAGLLEAHGGELISWLEARGFERKDADETDYESVQA